MKYMTFKQFVEARNLPYFDDDPQHHAELGEKMFKNKVQPITKTDVPQHHLGLANRMLNTKSGQTQQFVTHFVALLKQALPSQTQHLMSGSTFNARLLRAKLGDAVFANMVNAGFLIQDGEEVSVNM